jgi:hypothetical protein
MRYFMTILLIGVVLIIMKSAYDQTQKPSAKAARLACHTKSVVFEKVQAPSLLKELQNALRSGDVAITTKTLEAKHMPTHLFEYLKASDVEQKTHQELAKHALSSPVQKKASIEITIYENDKLDPGKKNTEAKLYAGYLIYQFSLDTQPVYKIQIDFMDLKASDVDEKIVCAIDSVMSL